MEAAAWVGVGLAVTFCFYGLLRKTGRLEAIGGLFVEAAVLAIPATAVLVYAGAEGWQLGDEAFGWHHVAALATTGVVTSLPLLCFAYGARRVRLATVGFFQYLAPTCMFVIGLQSEAETLTVTHVITFSLIWLGLVIYSVDSLRANRAAADAQHV